MKLKTTYLLTALATIFWGANFNLSKPVLAEIQPLVAGTYRYLIAAAIMVLIVLYKQEKIPLRHLRIYILLGIVGVFGFNSLFFLGMQKTSVINGALIMAINPLMTTFLAYFMIGEKPNFRQLLALPIAFLGVYIVIMSIGTRLHIAKGDAYILMACLSWAFYNVFVRKWMPKDTSGIASTAGIMLVGAVALFSVAYFNHESFIVPGLNASIALLLMTLCGGVLAYLFWNAGIAKLGASKASIFMNLVPVSSMLISILYGVMPTPQQWIGGLLVISAVTFATLPNASAR